MAQLQKKRRENIEGDFYVDSSCIDCDTCRWMSPNIFNRQGQQSAVYHQPENEEERIKALQALLSCPTSSIGTVNKPTDIKKAQQTIPIVVEDNVYHCGYHSEKSFAATTYFIKRSQGNILIDSPEFTPPLIKRLEEMGGVKYLYLTHKDDIADHQKFHDHFNCDRIMHKGDITASTKNIEIQLDGEEIYQLAEDILIIPVPGHTKGHTVLLYKDKFLFTGDHLALSSRLGKLVAFKNFCWYSWEKVIESMEKLTNYSFNWVLPAHGRRYHADSEKMQKDLEKCIEWMKNEG